MSEAEAKQIERMKAILEAQKTAFRGERHRPLDKRKADLERIANLCRNNPDAIAEAISKDFGNRAREESVLAEIAFVIQDAEHTKKHLAKWAKTRKVGVPMTLLPGKAEIRREPKGVAGIVSPWNYPFQLAMAPLVAALGAGCRAMIKPSEYTPATAELMKRLLADAFEEDHVAVITGGPAVGEAFTKLKFDHLFYTGSTQVGRLVAKAAAENLVPVTLELGGKSPAIVTPDYPQDAAAKSIAWGKLFNAGQTCVAPDYVLAPKGSERNLGEAIINVAAHQFPDASSDDAYTAIVSDRHYDRLNAMIEEARKGGAEILQPEHDAQAAQAARKIPPTVVINPPVDAAVMTEEIFGPVLPMVGYSELDAAIDFVGDRDHPLALYVYSTDKTLAQRVLDETMSGGAAVNINLLHLSVPDLPFGGVGASGQGAYHGEAGFLTFTHERSVFSTGKWHPSRLLAPPYGKMFETVAKRQMK
ncbi:coniferyl aldehyde dehydrogenase [Maricaulis sp.]|uniref:coniferyl aldehyde dehydrogenase n=1 Tax=Maricaulis sp. TaxID=1486257 RepID=UPI001B1DFF92|nr:coniferyl aldehyde dehydrogenase [Maricaulis sp.]MBO6765003.1 coniferyl aldehyde dehydrogenase [Maricaulis sp.]